MKYFLLLFLLQINNVYSSNNELQLRNELFNNYSKNIRPLKDSSDKINIQMGIGIKNLEEFNL